MFFRFKLLPWNWPWRIVTALLGCFILMIFVALLNTLTSPGRIAVIGRVVEVTQISPIRLAKSEIQALRRVRVSP